jgi:hypothetical protein
VRMRHMGHHSKLEEGDVEPGAGQQPRRAAIESRMQGCNKAGAAGAQDPKQIFFSRGQQRVGDGP